MVHHTAVFSQAAGPGIADEKGVLKIRIIRFSQRIGHFTTGEHALCICVIQGIVGRHEVRVRVAVILGADHFVADIFGQRIQRLIQRSCFGFLHRLDLGLDFLDQSVFGFRLPGGFLDPLRRVRLFPFAFLFCLRILLFLFGPFFTVLFLRGLLFFRLLFRGSLFVCLLFRSGLFVLLLLVRGFLFLRVFLLFRFFRSLLSAVFFGGFRGLFRGCHGLCRRSTAGFGSRISVSATGPGIDAVMDSFHDDRQEGPGEGLGLVIRVGGVLTDQSDPRQKQACDRQHSDQRYLSEKFQYFLQASLPPGLSGPVSSIRICDQNVKYIKVLPALLTSI